MIRFMAGSSTEAKTAAILCAILCAIFAAVAWSAAAGKSPTMDEPGHTSTGWFDLFAADFRLSPDVPALWEELIALPMRANSLKFDPQSAAYHDIRIRRDLTAWDVRVLFQTPGNDGLAVIRRARIVALFLGLLLAFLVGRWTWQLSGSAAAAVAATFIFCLDPNFLAHSPLVKNDVSTALVFLATAYALWRAGIRLNWKTAAAVVICVTLACQVKFSGLLLGPVALVVLCIRAVDPIPWPIMGRLVSKTSTKIVAGVSVCLVIIPVLYFTIWAGYGFRFNAGPNGLQLDSSRFVGILRDVQTFNVANRPASPADLAAWTPPLSTQILLSAEQKHLFPQAWIDGLIMTQSGSSSRLCFLMGQFYNGGVWYFFPLAMLFKSPLATILAIVVAAIIGGRAVGNGLLRDSQSRWSFVALLVPAVVYAAVAITSNVNIGLRHFFPVFPFLFIGVGLAVGRMWRSGALARSIVIAFAVGLAAETAWAYPNYIAFFNVLCGGPTGGYALLSDSNLDWGQDLPLLAQWQAANPSVPLYLDYFGRCDPAEYGIHYFNLPFLENRGGFEYGPDPVEPDRPCVIAVSVTHLHMLNARHLHPSGNQQWPPQWFDLIEGREPVAILGGTIYLYQVNPGEGAAP